MKTIGSPKSLASFFHFLGFSPKSKQFQCHKYHSITVLFSFLYFFCPLPVESQGNSPPESPLWNSEQILFITAKAGETTGYLDVYTLNEGEWTSVLEKIPVRLGRNGLLSGLEKREGDGNTPTGVFPIERIVGKQKKQIRNLEYTQIRKHYHWSDSPTSKNYNKLIKHREKGAVLLWDSTIYDLFIVIEHNTKPAVPGRGSMIFLHSWNEDKPTSGCVGVSKEVLETLVSVLDGDKKPSISIQILD
ncbi:L,D-transpeptidase catalytic domain protein [Leptospira wolbachii serovar Codice str. CDC]|uniref:L,D-transpeptidase catalytic domain protein n=1 Tax=Leptospira wolbachii serovar Codice str. CDC TaxID=1218599 RepID=R9A3W1_9LEPT|nr:L,D-transpeptidase family protein [Leptospira wolbachii]EOQ96913.1 L,D-transpeptidase catalytic domain protein [Leptospira wolbachii serovar Codice str. CDC]